MTKASHSSSATELLQKVTVREFITRGRPKTEKRVLLLPGGHVLSMGALHVHVQGLHPGVTARAVGALVELALQVVHRLVAP